MTLRTPQARALLASWWFDAEPCAGRDGGIGIRGRLKSVCPLDMRVRVPLPAPEDVRALAVRVHATLRPCTPRALVDRALLLFSLGIVDRWTLAESLLLPPERAEEEERMRELPIGYWVKRVDELLTEELGAALATTGSTGSVGSCSTRSPTRVRLLSRRCGCGLSSTTRRWTRW